MAARNLIILLTVMAVVHQAVSITFSSRILHRFSEDMKALRVSRSTSKSLQVSWPEKGSMEYYQVLLSGDFQRQKMKLGSQFQLLFPSEGSKTISLGNDFGWLHYTWIDIGTPSVSFLVALDAGSDLLWVPCDCIQCAPLSASYYSSLNKRHAWNKLCSGFQNCSASSSRKRRAWSIDSIPSGKCPQQRT